MGLGVTARVGARPSRRSTLLLSLLWALLAGACSSDPPAVLDTLVRQDSTYLTPGTFEPYSGPVVRYFPGDSAKVQLEGTLEDGIWMGELTVYHASGRIRYQGRLHRGAPCGAWVENREDEAAESVYQMLKQEIESMGLYPDCPEG